MKKKLLMAVSGAVFLTACVNSQEKEIKTLTPTKVSNWSAYIDDTVKKDFDGLYGVIYKEYDDLDTAIASLQNGKSGYDVLYPTAYRVKEIIDGGKLERIDYQRIIDNGAINKDMVALLGAEKGRYAIPYTMGGNFIALNDEAVKKALGGTLPANIFDLITDPVLVKKVSACGIDIYDNPTDAVPTFAHALGYNLKTITHAQYEQVGATMNTLAPYMRVKDNQAIKNDMHAAKACVTLNFNGDQVSTVAELKGWSVPVPSKGTVVWMDTMVAPKGANMDNFYRWVNHNVKPANAAKNAVASGYQTTVEASLVDKSVSENPSSFFTSQMLRASQMTPDMTGKDIKKILEVFETFKSKTGQ